VPPEVEFVLLEQLSSCLAVPMFIASAEGELLFFNEPAEPLVGRRFEESDRLSLTEWATLLPATDERGNPLADEDRPLAACLREREPVHRRLFVWNVDGTRKEIEGTAIPLMGDHDKLLGALGLFWEPDTGVEVSDAMSARRARSQNEVEVILMRRLASYLATPICIVGSAGQLLYFNAGAERIMGKRFDEMLASTRDELYRVFRPTELDGKPLERGTHPMTLARERRHPAHRRFCIHGMDGVARVIEGTSFPLIGQSGRNLGAVGIFWEIEGS
jgi:PAS domain-containing protein